MSIMFNCSIDPPNNCWRCVTCHHRRGWKPTEKLRPSLRRGRGRELRGAAPGPVPRPFSAGWGLSHPRPPPLPPPPLGTQGPDYYTTPYTHCCHWAGGDMFYCDPPPAIFKCGPVSRAREGQNWQRAEYFHSSFSFHAAPQLGYYEDEE